MDDQTPYIIVDNQRIRPLGRPAHAPRIGVNRAREPAPPFGVVDRVTISDEARERCRQYLETVNRTRNLHQDASLGAPEVKKLPYDASKKHKP